MYLALDTLSIQIRTEDGEKSIFKCYYELVEYYPDGKTAHSPWDCMLKCKLLLQVRA